MNTGEEGHKREGLIHIKGNKICFDWVGKILLNTGIGIAIAIATVIINLGVAQLDHLRDVGNASIKQSEAIQNLTEAMRNLTDVVKDNRDDSEDHLEKLSNEVNANSRAIARLEGRR